MASRLIFRGVLLLSLTLVLGVGGAAYAHVDPDPCSANRLGLDIAKNKITIINGETVRYTVNVFNNLSNNADACNITDTTVRFRCPAADGSPTGTETVLATGANFPVDGSGNTMYPPVDCVVTVNSGVTAAQAVAL